MKINVNFRVLIKDHKQPGLINLYRPKLRSLMQDVMRAELKENDYKDLPNLRKLITVDTSLDELAEVYQYVEADKLMKLISCAPVFKISPVDLKAYILLSLGIRSSHLRSMKHSLKLESTIGA